MSLLKRQKGWLAALAAKNMEIAAKKKPRGKPFEKGKSGNPKGRPKKTEEQKAKELQQEDVIKSLKEFLPSAFEQFKAIMEDPTTPPQVKVKIFEIAMDRVYGKAFQSVQIEDTTNAGINFNFVNGAERLAK